MRSIEEYATTTSLPPKIDIDHQRGQFLTRIASSEAILSIEQQYPSSSLAQRLVSDEVEVKPVETSDDPTDTDIPSVELLSEMENNIFEIVLNNHTEGQWFNRRDFDFSSMDSPPREAVSKLFKKLVQMGLLKHNGKDKSHSRYAINQYGIERLVAVSGITSLFLPDPETAASEKNKQQKPKKIRGTSVNNQHRLTALGILEIRRKVALGGVVIEESDDLETDVEAEDENKEDKSEPIELDIEELCKTNPAADYIINGLNAGAVDISTDSLRAAISQLAGSHTLENPSIMERFIRANEVYTNAIVDVAKQRDELGIMSRTDAVGEYEEWEVRLANVIKDLQTQLPAWRHLADCNSLAGGELFFPERGASTKEAKGVCRDCPMIDECLEYALSYGEKFGIWGGRSERERRRIRKKRTENDKKARAKAKDAIEATSTEKKTNEPKELSSPATH